MTVKVSTSKQRLGETKPEPSFGNHKPKDMPLLPPYGVGV